MLWQGFGLRKVLSTACQSTHHGGQRGTRGYAIRCARPFSASTPYCEMGGFLRWSLTLYPAGSAKSCGSGSEGFSSVMVKLCFPKNGLDRTESRLRPSCSECQYSLVLVSG